MKLRPLSPTIFLFALAVATISAADLDSKKIDELTGLKGKLNESEGVYRVTFPRADVPVSVEGWKMPPFMGLGTWAAFQGTNERAMMMGDTVLFEDEVNATMSAALDNGLNVTALHNHFFFDEPKVYFMHISGEGTVEELAGAVKKVYDTIRSIRAANAQPGTMFGQGEGVKGPLGEKNTITPEPLNVIFGMSGETNNGMVKFTIGRPAKMQGAAIGKDMGVNTWAAFAGSDDNAVVDGDFAVTEDELQPVIKSLRAANINIVAIHSHMTHEEPRILFLHYWGRGPVKPLAEAVKAALALRVPTAGLPASVPTGLWESKGRAQKGGAGSAKGNRGSSRGSSLGSAKGAGGSARAGVRSTGGARGGGRPAPRRR